MTTVGFYEAENNIMNIIKVKLAYVTDIHYLNSAISSLLEIIQRQKLYFSLKCCQNED